MTTFDGNRVRISLIGGVGYLIQRDTLYDLPVQTNDKMTAGLCEMRILQILKIIPILTGSGTGVRHIVDHYPVHLRERYAASAVRVLHNIVPDELRSAAGAFLRRKDLILFPFGVGCLPRVFRT